MALGEPAGGDADNRNALFASINKGADITKGGGQDCRFLLAALFVLSCDELLVNK